MVEFDQHTWTITVLIPTIKLNNNVKAVVVYHNQSITAY